MGVVLGQTAPFVDKRLVVVHGGNGGDGCIAFTKIFGNEFAGPDGGDGGNGGHVVFEVRSSSRSRSNLRLSYLPYRPHPLPNLLPISPLS